MASFVEEIKIKLSGSQWAASLPRGTVDVPERGADLRLRDLLPGANTFYLNFAAVFKAGAYATSSEFNLKSS